MRPKKFILKIYTLIINLTSILICSIFLPLYLLNIVKKKSPKDTSWTHERKLIYKLGIKHWENNLEKTGCNFKGKKILEVGSGNGQWLIALDNLGANKVIGVEPYDTILKFSKKKIKKYKKESKIELINASAEKLPFEENNFDCLLCLGVFMFTNFDNALREFERVLKPNGKIIMSFNGIGYLIMKFILGISFFKWKELSYSLHGFINSILYWLFNFKFGYAVLNYSVMKKLLKKNNFKLEKCFIHLDMEDQFMEEKFLFTTNYLIVGEKIPNK